MIKLRGVMQLVLSYAWTCDCGHVNIVECGEATVESQEPDGLDGILTALGATRDSVYYLDEPEEVTCEKCGSVYANES